jgi:hypothetical protein
MIKWLLHLRALDPDAVARNGWSAGLRGSAARGADSWRRTNSSPSLCIPHDACIS